jgi:predicted nucleotide-binding protein
MPSQAAEQLRAVADAAEVAAGYLGVDAERLEAVLSRAQELADSWSGSNLGYHANVYYAGLQRPPPGAHFSSEWGLQPSIVTRSVGNWREYASDEVQRYCFSAAPELDPEGLQSRVAEATKAFKFARSRFKSIVSVAQHNEQDTYINDLRSQADDLTIFTVDVGVRAQLPSGQFLSSDSLAVSQGLWPAPHQVVIAKMIAAKSPRASLSELADIGRLAADHLDLLTGNEVSRPVVTGSKVFIGHGRSEIWRALKDFVQDRLGLPWDEFNREPTAGITTTARLQTMLGEAGFALIVMTAEDEQPDGGFRARENVVHEAGLFQGRLGFTKAIVLLEEGCGEFSNIHGLGQVRFPRSHIEAVFEEVRRLLEREGMLEPSHSN